MSVLPTVTRKADRLYSIEFRPQELDLYSDSVRVEVRWQPMDEEPEVARAEHVVLLVLEITAPRPTDLGGGGEPLRLLKVGWEVDVLATPECRPDDLPRTTDVFRHVLERMVDAANRLAEQAGTGTPFSRAQVTQWLAAWK